MEKSNRVKRAWIYLKRTVNDFIDDECPSMAAAIAYYTTFSLPALLVLVVTVAGALYDPTDVRGELHQQITGLVGSDATEQLTVMLTNAAERAGGGGWATLFGIVTLIIGATGAFVELQYALNKTWEVEPDPEKGGVRGFLMKRLLSLGMIFGIAFLLLVSLVVSAVISGLGKWLEGMLPELSVGYFWVMDVALSLALVTVLVGAIFKTLPDAKLSWKDVRIGAFATTVLFLGGKFAIGIYLGNSDIATVYGAAGSLAIVLTWIYYSAMILLLGAEFTQVWAQRHGRSVKPEQGARDTSDDDK